jgi:hypothetical protein
MGDSAVAPQVEVPLRTLANRLVHKGLLVRITGKSKRSDQDTE